MAYNDWAERSEPRFGPTQFWATPSRPSKMLIYRVKLLAGNRLNGSIPKQLGNLRELTILDLSHNRFTERIPPDIGNASNLTKLYLNNNTLQGNIPAELGSLRRLRELRLDRNQLSGCVPGVSKEHFTKLMHLESPGRPNKTQQNGLCSLTNLEVANFAFNYLTGPLPLCLHGSSLSFQENCFNSKLPRQRPAEQCGHSKAIQSSYDSENHEQRSRWNGHLQSALVAGAFICLLLLLGAFFRYRRGAAPVSPSKSGYFDVVHKAVATGIPTLSRTELEIACEDFSNIIGTSQSGVIFKGTLSDGTEIAVTKVQTSSWSKDLELYFRYKVDRLASINHKHVVKLLGYCSEDEPLTRMLICEYTPNGTLFDLLHNCDAEQLDWNARMRIIMGVAYGLEYLHHNLSPPAGYSKFDSSSVYLTEDNAAKLAGFDVGKPPFHKRSKGKPYAGEPLSGFDGLERNFQDFEANVFGFGVLLLELISGRPPYSKEQGSIIDWAADYLGNPDVISYMVDPILRFFNYNQLESLCEITHLCVGADSNRPSMKVVTSMLETALGITSEAACPKQSPLLWAELAILTQIIMLDEAQERKTYINVLFELSKN
ncbi:hypothetical protein GOP47_0022037 [Adiantum capillus-veneris]|uniref:Protein kinase domain-containing protein n=1 Tax=Adiantum capillus-veneris TaxID=13818 RepID=A0A9D4Z752_ADICA|nr:hypothetical protein GOP47_0022037 [Adiantum capillus-veneris]